jgi:hypothetical protein
MNKWYEDALKKIKEKKISKKRDPRETLIEYIRMAKEFNDRIQQDDEFKDLYVMPQEDLALLFDEYKITPEIIEENKSENLKSNNLESVEIIHKDENTEKPEETIEEESTTNKYNDYKGAFIHQQKAHTHTNKDPRIDAALMGIER